MDAKKERSGIDLVHPPFAERRRDPVEAQNNEFLHLPTRPGFCRVTPCGVKAGTHDSRDPNGIPSGLVMHAWSISPETTRGPLCS